MQNMELQRSTSEQSYRDSLQPSETTIIFTVTLSFFKKLIHTHIALIPLMCDLVQDIHRCIN